MFACTDNMYTTVREKEKGWVFVMESFARIYGHLQVIVFSCRNGFEGSLYILDLVEEHDFFTFNTDFMVWWRTIAKVTHFLL